MPNQSSTPTLPSRNWEPLSNGWFVQWAVENESRRYPKAAITVFEDDIAICGYVPDDWDGSRIHFDTNPAMRVVHTRRSVPPRHTTTEGVRQPVKICLK